MQKKNTRQKPLFICFFFSDKIQSRLKDCDRQLKYNNIIYQWGVNGPAAFPERCTDTMAYNHMHIPACTLFLFSRYRSLMLCREKTCFHNKKPRQSSTAFDRSISHSVS